MEGNPFFNLLSTLHEEPSPQGSMIAAGRVSCVRPLRVQTRGLELTGDSLLVTDSFRKRLHTDEVAVGARVLLLTDSNQVFYLIGEVMTG